MPYGFGGDDEDKTDLEVLRYKKEYDAWWCGARKNPPKKSKRVKRALEDDDLWGPKDRERLRYRLEEEW